MKRKRLLALMGGVLVLALLLSIVVPISLTAASETFVALNPFGEIDAPYNQPLAKRLDSISGKTVGFAYWDKAGNLAFAQALATELGVPAEYFQTPLHFAQSAQWYEDRAGVDAVVFAVGDENMSVYWGAYHAREFEKLGVPCTIVITSRFEETLKCAAEDHGVTALRYVVVDKVDYSMMLNTATISGVTQAARREALVTAAAAGIEGELTRALNQGEIAPPAIVTIDAATPITFMAGDYASAVDEFTALSMEMGFGDGLQLNIPTDAAVSAMLEGTEREPDEIIGKLRMRNGIATIKKLAINAVMAGAEPEYFPVIIAALEVLVQGSEDNTYYYHAMTSGDDYTLMLILNGPIAEELGIRGDKGYMAAARHANNTIGRAVRMAIRNIGHNTAPYVDTATLGRHMDHTLIVTAEIENKKDFSNEFELYYELSSYLDPHHVTMGFDAEQSTVTVVAVGSWGFNDMSSARSEPGGSWNFNDTSASAAAPNLNRTAATTMTDVGGFMRRLYDASSSSPGATTIAGVSGSILSSTPGKDATLFFMGPGESFAATRSLGDNGGVGDIGDKMALKNWFTVNGTGGAAYAAHKNVAQPFVIGENPAYTRVFKSLGYGMDAFRTQLITGATITDAGQDPAAPSAPQDFEAEFWGTKFVTLTWEAPERSDGNLVYEVTKDGINWFKASGMSYTFEGVWINDEYNFAVRAVYDYMNAAAFDNSGNLHHNSSGRGAWAMCPAERVRVESLKINSPAMLSVARNSVTALGLIANLDATLESIVWASSDNSFATVDSDGIVTVLNKMGTVVITARDTRTGISHATVLRIT